MAREFAKKFYNSKAWKDCRIRYIQLMPKERRGLCELCYKQGKHVLGEELHHKIELSPSNIHDSNITLNHKNLILLCYECHKKIHGFQKEKRYIISDNGDIVENPKYR